MDIVRKGAALTGGLMSTVGVLGRGVAPLERMSLVHEKFRWGVWLGRLVCEKIAHASKVQLNQNRNLM